jgi:hypothetical protein
MYKPFVLGVGLVMLLGGVAAVPGQTTGYETLVNWGRLPRIRSASSAHLASSYDRDGGNLDWNWYPGYDRHLNDTADNDLPVTLLDVQGSGVLTRYWMPHATANDARQIIITVDAGLASQAVITTNSDELLYGGDSAPHPPLFENPMVPTVAGGQTSYEPIGFTASLKVESINRQHLTPSQPGGPINGYTDRHYYQLNYQLYHDGRTIQPYSHVLGPSDPRTHMRQQAASILNNRGQNPAGVSGSSTTLISGGSTIAPGSSVALASLANGNSGTIRRLNVQMDNPTDQALEDLRIRIRYDSAADYAVNVPVGAFFGAVAADAPAYQSLPMGSDSTDGFYCYLPMPYRDGVTVELYNAGSTTVDINGGTVEYESAPVSSDTAYLHAVYRESEPGNGRHQILEAAGRGHYIGNILTLEAAEGDSNGLNRSILEGDETIVVDGVTVLQGTGMEDAYNGGFYYNHVLDQNNDQDPVNPRSDDGAFSGLLLMETIDDLASAEPDIQSGITQVSQYRWQLLDLVPFNEAISMEIENHGGQAGTYKSTAFYYMIPEPGSFGFFAACSVWLLRRRRN